MSKVLSTIQQKVESVASKFTEAQYFYGNWNQLDKFIDEFGTTNYQKPVIFHIMPMGGTMYIGRGSMQVTDRPSVMIAFLDHCDFDADGNNVDEKVERMKYLAQLFIRALNNSGLFEMIDNEEVSYQVPYDTTDDNLTGVIVTFTLKEVRGRNICHIDDFGYVE